MYMTKCILSIQMTNKNWQIKTTFDISCRTRAKDFRLSKTFRKLLVDLKYKSTFNWSRSKNRFRTLLVATSIRINTVCNKDDGCNTDRVQTRACCLGIPRNMGVCTPGSRAERGPRGLLGMPWAWTDVGWSDVAAHLWWHLWHKIQNYKGFKDWRAEKVKSTFYIALLEPCSISTSFQYLT